MVAGLLLAGIFTWQFSANALKVSDDRTFASFQRDSEALVIGKIVSARSGVAIPMRDQGVARANLALAWVEGVPPSYDVGIATVLQGYELLNARSQLPDLRLERADIVGPERSNGSSAASAGVVVSVRGRDLVRYIGRSVRIDDEPRFLQSATFQGDISVLRLSGPPFAAERLAATREVTLLGQPVERDVLKFNPYTSQFGLQGLAFAWASERWGLSLQSLYLLAAVLLGCVLATLALLYARLFGLLFCAAFIICMFLSPWITNYGRNIYWVPFTWFLPAALVGMGLLARTTLSRAIAIAGYFAAVLLKCLCGYEYLSTVILFASAPCAVALVVPVRMVTRRCAATWLIGAYALGALAFVVALVCQSTMKAPAVWQGVLAVIEQDALRRTHGAPGAFSADGDAASSLSQTTWSVVWRYVFQWRTELIAGVPGTGFAYLVGAAAAAVVGQMMVSRHDRWRYGAMLVAFAVPAVSWYVLGKGHSARHYHMNYVLWYMGAVPVCMWICVDTVLVLVRRFVAPRTAAAPEVGRQAPTVRQAGGHRRGRRSSRK